MTGDVPIGHFAAYSEMAHYQSGPKLQARNAPGSDIFRCGFRQVREETTSIKGENPEGSNQQGFQVKQLLAEKDSA